MNPDAITTGSFSLPCTFYQVEQRTPEWHALRSGVLTASQFGAWLTKADATSRKARDRAACELIAQRTGCAQEPEGYVNWAMERGTKLEPAARDAFSERTGRAVEEVGFALSSQGAFGCSPDGILAAPDSLESILAAPAGLEIKVATPATHIKWLLDGEVPDEYLYQIHGAMAVTGVAAWHFWAWNPNLPSLHQVVDRSETTESLLAALIEFSAYVEELQARLSTLT